MLGQWSDKWSFPPAARLANVKKASAAIVALIRESFDIID